MRIKVDNNICLIFLFLFSVTSLVYTSSIWICICFRIYYKTRYLSIDLNLDLEKMGRQSYDINHQQIHPTDGSVVADDTQSNRVIDETTESSSCW